MVSPFLHGAVRRTGSSWDSGEQQGMRGGLSDGYERIIHRRRTRCALGRDKSGKNGEIRRPGQGIITVTAARPCYDWGGQSTTEFADERCCSPPPDSLAFFPIRPASAVNASRRR